MTLPRSPQLRAARLLRLYPRRWRERYGEEFSELLASEITERPREMRRTADVVRGGVVARLTYLGLGGCSLVPDEQVRASFAALSCCGGVFVLFGAVLWSQLVIGWQWSEPNTTSTAAAMVVTSTATFGLLAVALVAAAPVVCTLARRLVHPSGEGLLAPTVLVVVSSVCLFFGARHFGNGWPGTGGHHWAHQGIVPAGFAAFAWASTLSVSSYWAHPPALLHFPPSELAWMAVSPVGVVMMLVGLSKVLHRLPLGPRLLGFETQLAAIAGGVMALFMTGCALWVTFGGSGPHYLFHVGTIDVLGLAVMACAFVGVSFAIRSARSGLVLLRYG